ncbi:hypothetical protein [Fischerella sp. JS2]|uniref:hypothetical protein n=1 Tax=Fischerella sp. JS2 TaxID=2597771 RepID=UPI0028EFFA5D|nr:hypothetical protein [Fischerella sp. JS2]
METRQHGRQGDTGDKEDMGDKEDKGDITLLTPLTLHPYGKPLRVYTLLTPFTSPSPHSLIANANSTQYLEKACCVRENYICKHWRKIYGI